MQTLRSLDGAADWLLNRIEEHYRRTNWPMPLTDLGNMFKVEFGHKISELPSRFGQEFERFGQPERPGAAAVLRSLFGPKLEISAPEGNYARVLVKPATSSGSLIVGQSESSRGELQVEERHGSLSSQRYVRFVRPFWMAFVRQLDDGKQRFFWNSPPLEYRDVEIGETPGRTDALQIERKYILGLRPHEKPEFALVRSRIEEWAREKHVEESDFYDLTVRPREPVRTDAREPLPVLRPPDNSCATHLQSFLNSLPPELARRIEIPGDIVAFILREPQR